MNRTEIMTHTNINKNNDPQKKHRLGTVIKIIILKGLTLKAPRKKNHLKMSSAEVGCCKKMPSITDELSIEANSVDPE